MKITGWHLLTGLDPKKTDVKPLGPHGYNGEVFLSFYRSKDGRAVQVTMTAEEAQSIANQLPEAIKKAMTTGDYEP